MIVDTAVNLTASHATTLVDSTTICFSCCFPSTGTDPLCSGATQLRTSEEDGTLNEQLWFRNPTQRVNKLRQLTVPVLVDETM